MRYLRNVYEPVGIVSPGAIPNGASSRSRSEEHTSELQSRSDLVCRLLLEKKKNTYVNPTIGEEVTAGLQSSEDKDFGLIIAHSAEILHRMTPSKAGCGSRC